MGDDGGLVLDGLGEETNAKIVEFGYPGLREARLAGKDVIGPVQRERA